MIRPPKKEGDAVVTPITDPLETEPAANSAREFDPAAAGRPPQHNPDPT